MRTCPTCGDTLVQRINEKADEFAARTFCGIPCRKVRGEAVHGSKLTAHKVRAIRHAWDRGARNCDLAEKYNVSPAAISSVVHRRFWKHVD